MKDRNCDKTQYTCAICKTNYDTIQERARCEMSCVKKIEEEEKKAAEAGCLVSILFVKDSNNGARALYRKCGYQDHKQDRYGRYMLKELHTDM